MNRHGRYGAHRDAPCLRQLTQTHITVPEYVGTCHSSRFEQLHDELKYSYETAGEGPALRALGGRHIAFTTSKHNWQ